MTLIEAETLEALERDHGIALAPGDSRRNIVTRGVALNHLVNPVDVPEAPPQVLVFDLDDTLVRWQAAVRGAVQRLAAVVPVDREAFAQAVHRAWYGRAGDIWTGRMDLEEVTREATAAVAAGLGVTEEEAARLYRRYVGYVDELVVPYEDVEALRALAAGYRLGVATNGIGAVQRRKLDRAGLADLFAFVVVSAEVAAAKPDPAFYQAVRRIAGAPPGDIVVVGNHVARDLLPALAVGMRAVWLRRADDEPQEAAWSGPVITSLFELEAALRAMP